MVWRLLMLMCGVDVKSVVDTLSAARFCFQFHEKNLENGHNWLAGYSACTMTQRPALSRPSHACPCFQLDRTMQYQNRCCRHHSCSLEAMHIYLCWPHSLPQMIPSRNDYYITISINALLEKYFISCDVHHGEY